MGKTTKQDTKKVPNPTGKGGFGDNPNHINPGGRPKNVQRYDYWIQVFKDMSQKEFDNYNKTNPAAKRYVAENQAYKWSKEAVADLRVFQTIADRSEGKPQQSVDHTSKGEQMQGAIITFEECPEAED